MQRRLLALCGGIWLLWGVGCAHPHAQVPAEADASPRVVQLAKHTRSWDGALLPAYPVGQPEVTVLHITIPPGVRLPLHYHPVINVGVLLEGQLTVVADDGQRLALQAGDAIVELVNTPHYGINEGTVPAVIIVFYAGSEGGSVTGYLP